MVAAATWTENKKERRRCSVVFSDGAPIDVQLLLHLDGVENKNFELKRLAYLGLQFERFEAIAQVGASVMAATVPSTIPVSPASIGSTAGKPQSRSLSPSIRKKGSKKSRSGMSKDTVKKHHNAESASGGSSGDSELYPINKAEQSTPLGPMKEVFQSAATETAEPVGVQEFVMPSRGEVSEEHERLADMMFGTSD